MSFLNECVQLSQRANVDFKPLIDHFSALEYATKYATKQESRLEFTTRTRRRCAPPALAPPCRPAAETRARSRVRRASRHASAGASLSLPPKWCLAQSGSQPLLESKLWLTPWKLAQRTLRRCWRRFSALRRDWSVACVR